MLEIKNDSEINGLTKEQILKITEKSQITSDKIYGQDTVRYMFRMTFGLKPSIQNSDYYPVELLFVNDKLISIDIKEVPSDTREILEAKYGKPKIADKMTYVKCKNGFGASSDELNGHLSYSWGNTQSNRAIYLISIHGCGKYSYLGYSVFDSKAYTKHIKIQESREQELKSKKLKSKSEESIL